MLLRRLCLSTVTQGGVARLHRTAAAPLFASAASSSCRSCSSRTSNNGSTGSIAGIAGSSGSGSPSSSSATAGISAQRPGQREASINCVTLVGVVHDIQTGYVFEDAVTQFTLTTTSLDTTNPTQECVVEKDHHTVRCIGDVFSQEVRNKLNEGNVVCVNGRLRLNPQLEPSCNKYYYFPYIQVQPPHGQVSVVYGDRRAAPAPVAAATGEVDGDASPASEPGGSEGTR